MIQRSAGERIVAFARPGKPPGNEFSRQDEQVPATPMGGNFQRSDNGFLGVLGYGCTHIVYR
jgi:hypothetical protein